MTPSSPSFEQASRKIVTDFLHSVVVVDDRASLNDEVIISEISKEGELKAPSTRAKKAQTSKEPTPSQNEHGEGAKVEEDAPNIVGDKYSSRGLKAKILIDTFADKGLVCAVLKPIDHEPGLEVKTDHATQKSDIVILDWQISETETTPGEIALGLIKKIIETDSKDRLRLIAIYTTNPALHEITERIKDVIKTPSENAIITGFEITRGPIKVVVYQKSGGSTSIAEERVVEEIDLPEKLINDFTNLTKGLLSNVALKSLGALRENTHKILSKFNSSLDAPYVAHRILTNPPEEAETHPIPLIASEFNDVLEDSKVTECITAESINKWLDNLIEKNILQDGKIEAMSANDIQKAVYDLLKNGLVKEIATNDKHINWLQLLQSLNGPEKEKLSDFTKLLIAPSENAKERDSDFAILTTLRSGYSNPEPMLKLGSIIRKTASEYFVCIQPLCDSVRLTNAKCFPFLKLRKNVKDFDIVITYRGTKVYLKVDYAPHTLVQFKFKPSSGEKEVRAKKDTTTNKFFYVSEDKVGTDNIKYEWISDLKYPHAQRIINDFAYKFSRVGLMESDWLRRMAR